MQTCQGDAKTLWSKLRPLLRPGSNATSQFTVDDYVQFFTTKHGRHQDFWGRGQRGGKAEGIGRQTKIVVIGLLTDEN